MATANGFLIDVILHIRYTEILHSVLYRNYIDTRSDILKLNGISGNKISLHSLLKTLQL